jgi:hypothetical protein
MGMRMSETSIGRSTPGGSTCDLRIQVGTLSSRATGA